MRWNKTATVLTCIVLLAAAVRLYNLGSVAPSPYLDEVSNGYNAFSILKTGADEYGKHWPLLLQAYNDFRPALFVYLTIPFVAIFGLTTFAIRLPAVILHVLATVSMYFLTKYLLERGKGKGKRGKNLALENSHKAFSNKLHPLPYTLIPLLAALLYAISPWSIYSSRMNDEINMSLCFFIFALTFFLYWINQQRVAHGTWHVENITSSYLLRAIRKYDLAFLISTVLFVIAFYAYHGIKLFLPFFVLGLAIIYWRELWQRKHIVIAGSILGLVLLMPLFIAFLSPGTTVRLGAVNIIAQNQDIINKSSNRILIDQTNHDLIGKIFDNRRILLGLQVLQNYFRNFDPTWLFLQQDNRTFMVPDFGPLYLFELPLLLLGVYLLIKEDHVSSKSKLLLLIWIIASAIPSAVSSESPHLNRTNTMLPALTILQAMGLYLVLFYSSKTRYHALRYAEYTAVSLVIVISFIWFLHAYFVEFPYQHAKQFQYGTLQAFDYAKEHENSYDKIIVSNANNLLEGYMYYLFATKYDPAAYQKIGGTHSAFFTDSHLIGKYDFRDINAYEPKQTLQTQKILYITNPGELSDKIMKHEGVSIIQSIKFPDGSDSVWILQGQI